MEDKTAIYLLSEINQRLKSLNMRQKAVMTLKEALDYTGFGPARLYKATREKELPYYKNHGRIYFKREDLEAWMMQNRVSSSEEIETFALNQQIK